MGENAARVDVRHQPDRSRFVAIVDATEAVLDYDRQPGIIRLTHTGVPPAVEGRGIAAALVAHALVFARAEALKVDPACSYVEAYLRRHPEYDDLLA